MNYIFDILREYPAVTLFLTVGIGFLLGRVKIGSFSLGSVTAVLLVAVVIGQIGVPMSGPLKSVFFMMFLFSIGYSVGPKFFRSLKGSGLRQVMFAVLMSSMCFLSVFLLAKFLGYTPGEAVGMFAGSQTCSSLIGVGGEAIGNLPIDAAAKRANTDILPVCYAVTYIFGTLGTVIILGNFGPKLLGGLAKVKEQTATLEAQMDTNSWANDPANINALRSVAFRAYRVSNGFFAEGRTIFETEQYLRANGLFVFVDRIRQRHHILTASPKRVIRQGDIVVLCGRRVYMIDDRQLIGPEVIDDALLTYPVERIPVLAVKKGVDGVRAGDLLSESFMHGVVIRDVTRDGRVLDLSPDLVLEHGDTMTLLGRHSNLHRAAAHIGHMDRPTVKTDIMFVGLAIFIGGFLGGISIVIDSVPVSFGTSGGALLAGLVFGWLRSHRPTFGHIPDSALWLMNHLGLNVFIAAVGLESATSFAAGLKTVGPMLLLVGAVATCIPLFFGLWLGHKVFKFHPATTLGCCAGTRTCTAALGAVQDALGSTIPAMGYTVTYAVSNILLVIWGMVTVLLI